jgi:hypothetical protein
MAPRRGARATPTCANPRPPDGSTQDANIPPPHTHTRTRTNHPHPPQVAGIVAVICAGLYPAVVVPLQIAYGGREHPAQRRMREEDEARERRRQQQQEQAGGGGGGGDPPPAKPQQAPGFARKSMWGSINQAAKSGKS